MPHGQRGSIIERDRSANERPAPPRPRTTTSDVLEPFSFSALAALVRNPTLNTREVETPSYEGDRPWVLSPQRIESRRQEYLLHRRRGGTTSVTDASPSQAPGRSASHSSQRPDLASLMTGGRRELRRQTEQP